MPFRFGDFEISWLGHDTFRVVRGSVVLYFDPFQVQVGEPKADYILVTHEHFDHCDPPSIKRLAKPSTVVVAPRIARRCLEGVGVVEVGPGDVKDLGVFKVVAYPAYNVNKFRDKSRGVVFHPREDGRVAYLVEWGGVRVFHAGDSDFVPEFREVKADIVLVPVSGVYVMTAEEAAEFVNAVSPRVAIPMHYGSIVGSRRDAERFKSLVRGGVEVVILDREI
ncbi:MBL fold metallo-hydrolase [Pyrobaculum neutrophilum]|uniref:MBL fold metallo-hydrolase n=1 Tax=Pyrobaculum neutrophilum (strain DSM 2338 / JCM 9278 / NBRC 100436 / V24Sta) TaxID=444157 RepID=B1YA01_PYRNV|nr:MBL fold metallo-hydrolase [Pyrobaculum neutrophilum]ACB40551.1 conserved hypothetical protein [Pyrobaculum neutrophilum V24Sta]